jgi:hypothetical protein
LANSPALPTLLPLSLRSMLLAAAPARLGPVLLLLVNPVGLVICCALIPITRIT